LLAASSTLGPAPGASVLELDLECFSDLTAVAGDQHRVTVDPDWQVTTPHDAEAERIAEAFGGPTSCVTHVERVVVAFRAALGLLTRNERASLVTLGNGKWRVDKGSTVVGCCRGKHFTSIAAAAWHTRSPMHLAKRYGVPRQYLEAFLAAAAHTWGDWEASPLVDPRISSLVREPGGVGDLWRAGVHPDEIPSLAAAGSGVSDPLPVNFYLGLVYGQVDQHWVSEVLAHHPDPDIAAWLVWFDLADQQIDSNALGLWLRLGVSRADALAGVEAGIGPEYVFEIASAPGLPVKPVAAQLARWASVGCTLKAEHFDLLRRHGFNSSHPSSTAIDKLEELVAQLGEAALAGPGAAPDRTEQAVMLEILGHRVEVVAALRHGVANSADLDDYLASR